MPGGTTTVTVTVTAPGLLNAWVDFNNNGIWGDVPGEQIFFDQPVNPPANNLSFNVPPWAAPGRAFSRWRYSTLAGLLPTGAAPDGEVEDYEDFIEEPQYDLDWGDAPIQVTGAGYPTTAAMNGANHVLGGQLWMGALVDAEPDGQPTPMADGDDINGSPDEDGVVFLTPLVYGNQAKVDVIVTGAPGSLDAWIDYNADGDWNDPGEQIFVSVPVSPGVNTLIFTLPTMPVGPMVTSYARFRLSTAGGLLPTGGAPDGEVEDYLVKLESVGSISGTKWWDLNADGVRQAAEPSMGGWTIFIDSIPNGVLDVGEVSTVTNAAGQYTFPNLAPGTYRICEVTKQYWRLTNPTTGVITVGVGSGTNITGIDFLNWMLGDYDGDQDVDDADIDALSLAIRNGLTASKYDLNDDGVVDANDHVEIVTKLVFVAGSSTNRGTCYGDADLDGDVDLDDFVIMKVNWGAGATWGQADLDGDGDVDLDDFVILKNNWGSTGC